MPFIKVGNTILNTDQIVAVELNQASWTGQSCVVVRLAAQRGLFIWRGRELWFKGEAARALRNYFGSESGNVIDLFPLGDSRLPHEYRRPVSHPVEDYPQPCYEPPVEEPFQGQWDDLDDEPPPPPTVCRRPWGPQSPSPLSAMTFPEQPEPPVP